MKVSYGLKDSFKALKLSLEEGYSWHETIRKENEAGFMVCLSLLGCFLFIAVFVYLKCTGAIC